MQRQLTSEIEFSTEGSDWIRTTGNRKPSGSGANSAVVRLTGNIWMCGLQCVHVCRCACMCVCD